MVEDTIVIAQGQRITTNVSTHHLLPMLLLLVLIKIRMLSHHAKTVGVLSITAIIAFAIHFGIAVIASTVLMRESNYIIPLIAVGSGLLVIELLLLPPVQNLIDHKARKT